MFGGHPVDPDPAAMDAYLPTYDAAGSKPLSELRASDATCCDAGDGDDLWVCSVPDGVTGAAVVLGDHIILWQDEPLTDAAKKDGVAEYEETVAREMGSDEDLDADDAL